MKQIPYLEFENSPCSEVFLDEERGELVCLETGEVLEERLPIVEFQNYYTNGGSEVHSVYKYRDILSEAIELYRQGLPIDKIMKVTGVRSFAALYRALEAYGLRRKQKSPHRKLGRNEIAEICRELSNGTSIYSTSKKYGLSTSRVFYIKQKYCR